jgi:hypothetical protein
MKSKEKAESSREYLLEGASWQDTLLQSYRSIHITFQSILLAIGIGLVITLVSNETDSLAIKKIYIVIFLCFLWIFQIITTIQMYKVISNRGEDVYFWHRLIILFENSIDPKERFFTLFKISQIERIKNMALLEELKTQFLSETKISLDNTYRLVGKRETTRKSVDQIIFIGISLMWFILILASIWLLIEDKKICIWGGFIFIPFSIIFLLVIRFLYIYPHKK